MIFRSRAPLRIGLAGGGTDVSPYSELYGGAVINTAISHFACADIETIDQKVFIIHSTDGNILLETPLNKTLPVDGTLDLVKGMYNRILKDYGPFDNGIRLSVTVDAPLGSGLGTSSTLMVALAGAFRQMLSFSMDNGQLAQFAYEVERIDLGFAGGKQDQYAAVFGGFNFMEFLPGDKTIVTPLQISSENIRQLENNLVLYYSSLNRDSSSIISEQQQNVVQQNLVSIEAMHALKTQSKMMLTALTAGQLDEVGKILDFGFRNKKNMARNISNPLLDSIYEAALSAGATGGKISGAGGGGFMIFYCPDGTRSTVCEALHNFDGYVKPFTFSLPGLTAWTE
jgi:D-glycero-alpha-D-manno-heptose-7-phosphate kinase